MFEGVLYQLLAGYLGHYVKDINREHFRLGLWSGEALLENVEVRLEAFDYLQLPFSIKQGFVGKLRIQVPWSKLGWEPILIALDNITLLAAPHEDSEYGAEASERRALAAKKAGLAAAEIAKLSQRVSEDKSGETFLSYLSAKVIDNVQVTVTNVHIQYMDVKTDPERSFSFGITLRSLIISTTDGRDHPVLPGSAAGKGVGSPVYKLVKIKELAVYWNSDIGEGSQTGAFFGNEGSSTMHNLSGLDEEVVYLLRPTNATLRLTVEKKATVDGGVPHYSVAADVDDLSLALEDRQLIQMLLLMDVLSMSRLRERYAPCRPQISTADSERAGVGWQRRLWTFAIQAVLSDVRKHLRGSTWSYFSWRSERQKRYVSLYKEKIQALQRVQPAGDLKCGELEEMEREFEMDEILYFRSLAENQFQLVSDAFPAAAGEFERDINEADQREDTELLQETQIPQRPLSQQRGWLNWLSLGLLGAAESIDAAVCPDEIIKDLCEAAADFDPTVEIESGKSIRGKCQLILSLSVGRASGSLRNSSAKEEIVKISVSGTLVTFSLWQESSSVFVTIPTLEVVDRCPSDSQFSCILIPKSNHALWSSSSVAVQHNCSQSRSNSWSVQSTSDNFLKPAHSYVLLEGVSHNSTDQIEAFVKFEVEFKNKTQDFEVTVNVTVQPFEFVYSPTFVDGVLAFFSEPMSLYTRRELVVSGPEKLESIAGHTRAKAEFAFATRKRVGWHVDIQRPTFVFPDCNMGTDCMLMIWAWESLFIASAELQSTASSSADMQATKRLWGGLGSTRCYERLEVCLVGAQVIIVNQTSNWHGKVLDNVDLGSNLVERFNLQIAVCFLPSDPTKMTLLKMSGEISALRLHVSSGKCNAVKAVLTQILESGKKINGKCYTGVKDKLSYAGVDVSSWKAQPSSSTHSKASRNLCTQGSHAAKPGSMPAALELNLNMKDVTVKLCVDGQSGSLLQQMTFIAQMRDMSIWYTRWASQEEVQLTISRVHIEDANELAGSSLRYLLFDREASSSALRGTSSGSENICSSSLQGTSNKTSFVGNLYTFNTNESRKVQLDFSLQGMEWHSHPRLIRALYGFINAVAESKGAVTSLGTQSRPNQPSKIPDEYSLPSDKRIFRSGAKAQDDSLSDATLCLGVQLKDIAIHMYDPGGIIAIMVFSDASLSISLPASVEDMLKVSAVVRGLTLKGPRWASGNVGGDPFGHSSQGPAATLSLTVTKTGKWKSGLRPESSVVEVDATIQNGRWILLNDYLAVLIGYFMSSQWKFSTKEENERGGQGALGTSKTSYLCKVEANDSVVLLPSGCGFEDYMELNISKLVVSFTPADVARVQADENSSLGIDSSLAGEMMLDTVWIECQELAVTLHGFHENLGSKGGDHLRLFERIDGEMTLKIPSSEGASEAVRTGTPNVFPITADIDLSALHINLAGSASRNGAELLKHYQKELSSIPWKYRTYASVGFHHGFRDRSPFEHLKGPPASDSLFSLKARISQLIFFVQAPQEPFVNLARLQAESLNIIIFSNEGVIESLKIELLSLNLLYGPSSKRLLHVTTGDDKRREYESSHDLFPLLVLANDELHIAVPCTKVWLHLCAWGKVITALVAVATIPTSHIDGRFVTMASSQQDVPLGGLKVALAEGESLAEKREVVYDRATKDNCTVAAGGGAESGSYSRVMPSDLQDLKRWPVLVKVGIFNVVFILPDYEEEDEEEAKSRYVSYRPRLKHTGHQLLWTDLGSCQGDYLGDNPAVELLNGEGHAGKQILFSWLVRIDEIQPNKDGWCTLSACITHAEAAVVENFGEGQSFRMRFLQMTDMVINGQISFEQSPLKNAAVSIQVDSVDAWCSYTVLHFLNTFCFEQVGTGSSSSSMTDNNCSLEIRLQSCLLLLSDSRWSCNAPIIEIFLGDIVAQVHWRKLNIETSLSSAVEINYHNIQKVAWEPLLEPWNVCCKITRVHESNTTSRPFRTKVEVTSSTPLNLNITEALIQAISRAVEMFSDSWKERNGGEASADIQIRDSKSSDNSAMRRYAPYWLQNDTGVPFSYWLCGGSKNKEIDDDTKASSFGSARSSWGSTFSEIVQPGCSVPLYVEEGPDEVFLRRRAGHSVDGCNARKMFNMPVLHRMICVQLEGTARPSVPMSIDLVGSISFEAVFSDGDSGDGGSRLSQGSFQEIESERGGSFSTPVIFEVTVQRYSKLVRLYSMVSLVNTTSLALEIRFDIPFLISPKVMDPILPGHVMALPVHLAETGRMRWRPLGNNHMWSEVQLLPNLLQSTEGPFGFHRPVVCYPFNPSNGPFRCCIAVENHFITAAEAVSTSKRNGEQRDVIGHNVYRDNLGRGISSSSDKMKGCMTWNIFLKAPLVLKNCLPCSLAITIETGAGVISSGSAPEGDSLFLYDVDTAQDLNVTILAPTYLPNSLKLASASSFPTDILRNTGLDRRISLTQELNLKPEITTYASVTVEMEMDIDVASGARELRISVPFWLYNCSYLHLAVMDGDVDMYTGREQPLGGVPFTDEERAEEVSLHSTGSRSWPAVVNGLQVSLEGPEPEATNRVMRRSGRSTEKVHRTSTSQSHLQLDLNKASLKYQKAYAKGAHGQSSAQGETCEEKVNGQMLMYSPVQGTETSELHLRARVVRSLPTKLGKEPGEVHWSRPFLVEPPGGSTAVAIPQPEGNGAFVVAVISAPALGSCAGKTKTITFRPRFLLANVSKKVLCYRQQGTDKFQRLERGKRSQLHWHDVSREFLISMRIDEHGWDWSGGFNPDQLGDTQVKVRNHTTGDMHMLRVEVSSMLAAAGGAPGAGPAGGSLGTCLIMLSDDETGFMPYRIENFTLERLRFHQQKCEKMENMLQPYSSCSYAWDEPCRPHRLIIEVPGAGDLGAFWLDEVKDYPAIIVSATSENVERRWLVRVCAEGPIRVLSIVDGTVHTMKGLVGVDEGISGGQFQETGQNVEPNSERFGEFVFKLSYVGFSIIDDYPQEVIYGCAKGIRLQLLHCQHQQILKLDVAWFQVDNQLRYAVYPVMLSVAKSSPKLSQISQVAGTEIDTFRNQVTNGNSSDLADDAAFSISIGKWGNPTGSVDCFQHIYVRLEPLRLELEERVVSCLLHLMDRVSWSASTADMSLSIALTTQPWSVVSGSQLYGVSVQPFATTPWKYDMVHVPTSNTLLFTKSVKRFEVYRCWAAAVAVEPLERQLQKLIASAKERRKAYVEMLHVAPVFLTVSFSSAPWLSDKSGAATRSLLWMTGTLLQRQVRALADVEGAPVHLRQLKLAHPFASWDVIRGMITRHYTRQLLQEVYKVLGSADVFGNPVGFIRSMASGMWEFVSAPTRSSFQSPAELVRGVAQGTRSLFTNTVFAFSNAATRMSRAARKGVTVFTMDSAYDQQMERLLQLEGSKEISVVNEFLESLTGLLQAPIRGAERHGLPGMLSGMALGAVGVVARPVASILEVAGMTAQSIQNRSRPTQWHATRVRLPRHVNNNSPLLLYSWERAVGQAVLLEAEGGRLKNEVYFTCKPLVQKGKFLLLTESKILRVKTATLADTVAVSDTVHGPKWKLELEGAIDDILHIDQVGNEVSLLFGPPVRPLIRPHHHAGGSSKYTTRFTPFAHETFELVTQSAADEFLEMVRLLEYQHRKAPSKLLLASSTSISCPDFLDLDKFF